jgi:hypothetical protein
VRRCCKGLSIFLSPCDPAAPVPPWLYALRLIPSVLLRLGPRVQELQARANPPR